MNRPEPKSNDIIHLCLVHLHTLEYRIVLSALNCAIKKITQKHFSGEQWNSRVIKQANKEFRLQCSNDPIRSPLLALKIEVPNKNTAIKCV